MPFNSFLFIFYFLPCLILLYYLSPKVGRRLLLLFASGIFYFWCEPKFILLLFILSGLDYLVAIFIERYRSHSRTLLLLSIILNTFFLCYFKYTNFFISETNGLLGVFGYPAIEWKTLILPAGISFITFHKISYVVDVYRKISKPVINPLNYYFYIFFFPKLISGPILRYQEIEQQLNNNSSSLDDFLEGFYRFSLGLAKKVLIADVIGHTADNVFNLGESNLSTGYAWLGIIAYTGQIYFDFSGYSDMAIGLARIFGFKFPENFDQPYLAKSFSDFWRRWHMTFSRWMREYLYYPLGGNRCSKYRNYLNLWIVFFFSGLWHGSQWTFILWGMWHGFFITIEKLFLQKKLDLLPYFLQVFFTLFMVMLSRVLFRSEDLTQSALYYSRLITEPANLSFVAWGTITSSHEIAMIILAYFLCLWRLIPSLENAVNKFIPKTLIAKSLFGISLLALSLFALSTYQISAFIYFQF